MMGMAEVVIGLPRIEAAVERLGADLEHIARTYSSIALPLPRGLCRDLVGEALGRGDDAVEEISLRYLNTSLTRVWWGVIRRIPDLALRSPEAEIICYEEDLDPSELMSTAYRIASLLIRARISIDRRIDPRPWIELFKPGRVKRIEIPGARVIIADGYNRYLEIIMSTRWRIARTIGWLIPTPLEVIELIARGAVPGEYAEEAVRHSIKYLGDYVIGGRDLTEAYTRLASDEEYLSFLRRIGISINQLRDLYMEIDPEEILEERDNLVTQESLDIASGRENREELPASSS
jgi:hypothetical protein